MPIMKWEPFDGISQIQNRINQVLDESRRGLDKRGTGDWRPAVDIYESKEAVVILAELPGVKKEDLSLEVKDNVLTLKGEKVCRQNLSPESYFCQECCAGSFHRAFTLRDIVPAEQIQAKFKDGILEIVIPKPTEDPFKRIRVPID